MLAFAQRKLKARDIWLLTVCSMEQIIGTALSCVVGIMIPLIQMLGRPELSAFTQGLIGASGLIGIAVGSAVIGRLMDIQGYAGWFRACPIIIVVGSVFVWIFPQIWCLVLGMFVIGIGVGGGYSLDSAYISELMPERWRLFMVGVAKASCALGFILAALIGWLIIRAYPYAKVWPWLSLMLAVFGLVTFLIRLGWPDSPRWLMNHGKTQEAQAAGRYFAHEQVQVLPCAQHTNAEVSWLSMWKGRNLLKVIYSGIPWACEGLGVYGFGVFLPILVMALGIESSSAVGIPKILNSVQMTIWINLAIVPGFVLGLWVVNRLNHANMMGWGFIGSAVGLLILLGGYMLHWPVWVSVVGFMLFEVALNAGPHLITFIIPAHIYSVDERGAGTGIAAMLGKIGAVLGVFLMPLWLKSLGMVGVLLISTGVMLAGALITWVFGKLLKLV